MACLVNTEILDKSDWLTSTGEIPGVNNISSWIFSRCRFDAVEKRNVYCISLAGEEPHFYGPLVPGQIFIHVFSKPNIKTTQCK